ncbi:MAG: hypothetical protein ACR2JW_14510 [Thermomicrobiales bacterium]
MMANTMQRQTPAQRTGRCIASAARLLPALGMALVLLLGGVWSGTIRHDPSPAFLARWGYDLDALRGGRIHTLVTMTLFPTAHDDWLPMLLQTVALVALAGWFAGAWRAVAAFWAPNIAGTALVSLCVVWPLDAAGYRFSHNWATEPDSGASVGIYGALGFVLALLPRRLCWVVIAGVAAWLVLAIIRERHVWNIEHLGGAMLGLILGIDSRQRAEISRQRVDILR